MENVGTQKPEFSGSFLFLVELARLFASCNQARRQMNIFSLFRNVEAAALNLSGYYLDNDAELKMENNLNLMRVEIDQIARLNKGQDSMMIPKRIWEELYTIERYLRLVWKDSGLQMSIKDYSDDITTF